jgi:hypothetical protein
MDVVLSSVVPDVLVTFSNGLLKKTFGVVVPEPRTVVPTSACAPSLIYLVGPNRATGHVERRGYQIALMDIASRSPSVTASYGDAVNASVRPFVLAAAPFSLHGHFELPSTAATL